MRFDQLLTESVRLSILQLLEQDPDYSHNEQIIQMALQALGHSLSLDRVRTELRWLEEQGLLSVNDGGDLFVARLNQRGSDVAQGHARIDGIARVRP